MSYVAFYRKFRPITFSDMVGQENIVKILQHQIENNQVGHAYLFCGGRGTGKTSTAKIFARAVNCTSSKSGEPCNQCEVCKQALSGALVDIMEIDAASNTSVDNIRSIRDDIIYAPTLAKYKVYIIDEVHMLSAGAFNALLKTLEEPPEHVIFILATTEPHKIPVTILSRCQRFDFKRISEKDIVSRLAFICNESNIPFEDDALHIIAKMSEGALRDAISILDQVSSSGISTVSSSTVKDIMGIADYEVVFDLLNSILNNDVIKSVSLLSSFLESGKDIKYFIWELISYSRDILIYASTKDLDLMHNILSKEQLGLMVNVNTNRILNIISVFSELENTIKWSAFPNTVLESAIIKLCSNNIFVNNPEEKRISSNPVKNSLPATSLKQETKNTVTSQNSEASSNWNDVLNKLKSSGKVMLYGALVNTSAHINNDIIEILFSADNAFGKTVVEKQENIATLSDAILATMGKSYTVKCITSSSANNLNKIDELENKLKNSGINIKID